MKVAVETSVDPQLALSHAELSQVAVDGEGARPVQPDRCQVAVHQDGGHILWSWRGGQRVDGGMGVLSLSAEGWGGLMYRWYLH